MALAVAGGDTLFVHPAKASTPFDVRSEHAVREYRAGKTTTVRDFLAGEIDEPDEDGKSALRGLRPVRVAGNRVKPMSGRCAPRRAG
ncbi:MAG: hypothetical protein R2853_15080 [Thermomicrobiales bacterium]